MSLAVFGIYKAKASVELDLEVQNILQEITVAVSWNQLEAALKAFFGLFEFETEEEGEETIMIRGLRWRRLRISFMYRKNI